MLLRKKLYVVFAIACLPFVMAGQPIKAAQISQGAIQKQLEQQIPYLPDSRKNPASSPTPSQNILYGVSALKQNDIWATGYAGNFFSGNGTQALIEHWNGFNWRSVQPPNNRQATGADLYGIAALSSNNVYAVGESGFQAYVIHWNGVDWQIKYANKGGGNLLAVAAVGPNDIWTAGSGLFLHWNGKTWHGISNINIILHAMAIISENDIWAVGVDESQRAVIEHWNGSNWSRVDSILPGQYASLNAITAINKKNIWAIGQIGTQTVSLHWDGTNWQRISSRNPEANYNNLTSISALGENDIWAAGFMQMDTCLYYCAKQTLIEHWNGKSWQMVGSPDMAMQDNVLQDVTALSADNVWAVGTTYAGYESVYGGQMLIEHWDGQHWKIVSSV